MKDKVIKVELASSACSAQSQENTSISRASPFAASAGIDKSFVISAGNILQALLCLSDLIRAEADNSRKVREYANLADENLQTLRELMRPMLWSPA